MPDQGAFFEPVEQARRGALLPSKTSEHATPTWLYERMHREFGFTVDAAAAADNAKCERFYTKHDSGMKHSWQGERVWCNPPYDTNSLTDFSRKAYEETRTGECVAVLLVPVKTDQQWWHSFAIWSEVRFIRGRLVFGDAKHSAPMPVCLLVFGSEYRPRMLSMDSAQLKLGGV